MNLSREYPAAMNIKALSSDKIGIFASIACIIHCVALPVVAGLLPLMLPAFANDLFHVVMLLLIVPVTFFAVWNGYKKHKMKKTIITSVIGVLFLTVGILMHDHGEWVELVLTTLGGAFLIWTHIVNIKACRCCSTHAISCHK